MKLFRAWITVAWVSFRRMFWSSSTAMVLFPLLAGAVFVLRRGYGSGRSAEWAFNHFSEFLVHVFLSFLVPICALAFGTTSIGADREDGTLLFLLVRPVPRWLVLFGKLVATVPLVLGFVAGTFLLYCRLAGDVGSLAYRLYLPAVVLTTLAYVGVFQMFSVMFRHATIVSLVYALFMELLLGNMPGMVKRITVNYYGRSLMYAAGGPEGFTRPDPRWFEPVSVPTAGWALWGMALVCLLLAVVVFTRREYRDLS